MTQLSYPTALTNAFAGMLADLSPRNDCKSYASEEATPFPHGTAVVHGTDPETQALLPTGAATLLGVTVHSHANEVGADNQNLVDENQMVNVLGTGRIYVQLETSSPAVVAGTTGVFVRIQGVGAGEGLGRFRGDADTADALAVTGARWITGGGPDDVVILEIDPGASIA